MDENLERADRICQLQFLGRESPMRCAPFGVAILLCAVAVISSAEQKHKVIIDQDGAGPGGTDQNAILLLIQSPQTEVVGITVVTGDSWLKEEVAHTLRTLEIIGRPDIPVVPGAEYPLVRRKEETELWEKRYGSFTWLGAWTPGRSHRPLGFAFSAGTLGACGTVQSTNSAPFQWKPIGIARGNPSRPT
jgi:hypothetical protein